MLKYLIIIVILSAVGAGIAYFISLKTGRGFDRVLEYTGVTLMIIGLLSVLGNRNLMRNYSYTMSKFAVDVQGSTKSDIEMKFDSYKFSIITGLSGLILLLISLAIWQS